MSQSERKDVETIGAVEASLQQALIDLAKLVALDALPPRLASLRYLIPPAGAQPHVQLRYRGTTPNDPGRDMRADAAASYWNPIACEARITYEADVVSSSAPASRSDPATGVLAEADEFLSDVIRFVDEAERNAGKRFIALKWFRDQFLSRQSRTWVRDERLRHDALRRATETLAVLTYKEANPVNPEFPVTALKLNRAHPVVRSVLGLSTTSFEFAPIKIRGEPMSETIIRERR
jgi:hypothetical protein